MSDILPETEKEQPVEISNHSEMDEAYLKAKCLLMQCVDKDSGSMYDYLVKIIKRLLKEADTSSKENWASIIETVRRYCPVPIASDVKESKLPSKELEEAQVLYRSFKETLKIKDKLQTLPDFQQIFTAFEKANIGLSHMETFQLTLSVRKFISMTPVRSIRFWGKIFGIYQSYYVLETVLEREAPIVVKPQYLDRPSEKISQKSDKEATSDVNWEEIGPIKSLLEQLLGGKVPCEAPGSGLNKNTYFVCTDLNEGWIELPDVRPAHIKMARLIRKLFTGNLESPIQSFPPFPGLEKHYLRAQIARISAATTVSPADYYQFEEEEEAIEEEGEEAKIIENPEFEPIPVIELANPNLENWVHHTAYILPQGRVTWYDPTTQSKEKPVDENYEEMEEEETEPTEPETGPPLLTSIAEDKPVGKIPAWSVRITSKICPENAYALLSSNRWPGAHTIASGRFFQGIYIGWGQKAMDTAYAPMYQLLKLQENYFPELQEVADPTVEEEQAYLAAKAKKEEAKKARERELEEEQQEEEQEEPSDEDTEDE